MASVKLGTYTAGSAWTVTNLNSLNSSLTAGWQSAVQDNDNSGANLWVDTIVTIKLAIHSTTIANDRAIYVYAYGSYDNGTTYTSSGAAGPTGSEGTYTFPSADTLPTNYKYVGAILAPVVSQTQTGVFSIASAFQGVMPQKWGLLIRAWSCTTGSQALASSGNSIFSTPIYYTVT
jgi:hypothetical protein